MLTIRSTGGAVLAEYDNLLDELMSSGSGDIYEQLLSKLSLDKQFPTKNGLILCVPCINKKDYLRRVRPRFSERVLSPLFEKWNSAYEFDWSKKTIKNPEEKEAIQQIYAGAKKLLRLTSNILTLYSFAEKQSVFFTPKLASTFFGQLAALAECYRGKNIVQFNRYLIQLGDSLREAFPLQLVELLQTNPVCIHVISDLPIEWLRIDGVPLMFKTRVTRLPMSHSPLLLNHYLIARSDIRLGNEAAQKVLILNCLASDDKLHGYPRQLANWLSLNKIPHSYKTAASLDEYKNILKEEMPFILIHFGHGAYDRDKESGVLQIGKNQYHMWDYEPGVVPAIVLLGACWTASTAEESSDTPATAYLSMGARAVLGTLLPVQADRTNALYADILDTLWTSLRGETGFQTWGNIVWSALSKAQQIDILWDFNDHQRTSGRSEFLTSEVSTEYGKLWNKRYKHIENKDFSEIYKGSDTLLQEAISNVRPNVLNEFQKYYRRGLNLPHAMFYSHLGSPDTIKLLTAVPAISK
jgi:hypothetical protein